MTGPSPVEDIKIVSSVKYLHAKYIELNKAYFLLRDRDYQVDKRFLVLIS